MDIKSRGIFNIIHLFYHFTKSYNDRLYHFVWIYYIIHLKIPYLISSVSFVIYYNIIQMNYNIIHFLTCAHAIAIFYSTCRTPSRTSHQNERKMSNCHDLFRCQCSLYTVTPLL